MSRKKRIRRLAAALAAASGALFVATASAHGTAATLTIRAENVRANAPADSARNGILSSHNFRKVSWRHQSDRRGPLFRKGNISRANNATGANSMSG